METQKDRSLRRRIQSLQCFLFEQLHRELLQAQPQSSPTQTPQSAPDAPSSPPKEPTNLLRTAGPGATQQSTKQPAQQEAQQEATASAATDPAASSAAGTAVATAADSVAEAAATAVAGHKSSNVQQEAGDGQVTQEGAAAEGATHKTVIDSTFGIVVKQRTKVATGAQADKFRESRSFQVLASSLSTVWPAYLHRWAQPDVSCHCCLTAIMPELRTPKAAESDTL